MKNIIDRSIEFLSPKTGLHRAQARKAMEVLEKRAYDGAAKGRRTDDWRSTGASANMEVHVALAWLRNRSRELVRNNPYAKNSIRVIANNTVGTGIEPTPKFVGKNAGKINDTLKDKWKTWAGKINCDFDGQLNMYGIQHLAMKAVAESGECLIRKIYTTDVKFPIKLQVLEADFIDTYKHELVFDDKGLRRYYGIEYNRKGERVGYWIYKMHPVEFGFMESVLVPAADILHIYEVERPGQIRGIPFSASSMLRMRDLDKYEDAELIRQQIAACFTVFITDDGEETDKNSPNNLEKVEPGIIEHLRPGKSVTFATPPITQGYEAYTKTVKQSVAAGNGLTYEAMTGDLSNVNFSSGRMGWLETQRNFAHWQWNMLIPKFCDPVYTWFVEANILLGNVPAGVDIPVGWTPPRREMINPLQEGKAQELQMRSMVKSWGETVKENGYNPEEVMAELIAEQKAFKDAGLMPTSNPMFDSTRQSANALNKEPGGIN